MNTMKLGKSLFSLLLPPSFLVLFLLCLLPQTMQAESARDILDKAAQSVSNPGGVEAQFQMISPQFGNTSGTIAVKGTKFHATTPQASIWFDGKTQWTYMQGSDEVNVSTPTEAQLQAINPYNFINMYRDGFKLKAKKVEKFYEVHLKATDKKRRIQEMYIIVDQQSYHPTHVKMLQRGKWSTILISNLKKAQLSDALFQFNQKDFPQAEIIDLR